MNDRFFKDNKGEIFAVQPIHEPKEDWIELTEEELKQHLNKNSVPISVSKAQGKTALILNGLWFQALEQIDRIQDPVQKQLQEVQIHDTNDWLRNSPMLNMLAHELEVTQEELDNLFIQQSELEL